MIDRLSRMSMPEPNTGCWLWLGTVNKAGYGRIMIERQQKRVHRIAYELLRGPVPPGLVLDHLCRVRTCINPDHMEPVTMAENVQRGPATIALSARTHCDHGHPLAHKIRQKRGDRYYIRRFCITCRRLSDKKRRAA